MEKLSSIGKLEWLRNKILSRKKEGTVEVHVCMTGCRAYGAAGVLESLKDEVKRQKLSSQVEIRATGCHGFCAKAPVIAIEPLGVQYQEVEPTDAAEIVALTLKRKQLIDRLAYRAPKTFQPIFYRNQIPFYAKQERRILANCGRIDPTNIEHYIAAGGYQALVKALSKPQVRGQWGEITLRRLVELAGMTRHCDFEEQVHVVGEDGSMRPDMVIHMPDDRDLVVDVKTPLDAYLAAVEATSDEARTQALRRHAQHVAERVRLLSSKNYAAQFPSAPQFVILFVPGDQFLSAALDEQPELLESAMRNGVILATPSSFVALLKAVHYGWQNVRLAEGAEQIRKLAEDLYNRVNVFRNHLSRLGSELESSVRAYNAAVGSLERNVLPGARKFTELGVRSDKLIEPLEAVETTVREMSGSQAGPPEDTTE